MESICIILNSLLILPILSKKSVGLLSTDEEFSYLDRFCYQSEGGDLEYVLTYPTEYKTHSLLLYYDSDDQWTRAYQQLKTCHDRIQLLTNHSENNQIVHLSPYDIFANLTTRCIPLSSSNGQQVITCSGKRSFRSMRSRWWFLAIAVCGDDSENKTDGIHIEYMLRMTNGDKSNFFHYQFSDDEWLILPSDILFIVIHSTILVTNFVVGVHLRSRNLYHNTYRMSTHALFLETFGLSLIVFAHSIYGFDGVGVPIAKMIGQLNRGLGQILFIFMTVVLARGLNVVKMRLSRLEQIILFVWCFCFLCTYILMLLWEIRGFDPALVFYKSESVPGYLMATWKLGAWLIFVLSSVYTLQKYQHKKNFYLTFIVLLSPWYLAGPVVLCIANFVLNNWVREGVVNIVDNCVTTYGYIVFMYISWPSSSNTNFPFHIRTSQISCEINPENNYAAEESGDNMNLSAMRPQITTTHDKNDSVVQ